MGLQVTPLNDRMHLPGRQFAITGNEMNRLVQSPHAHGVVHLDNYPSGMQSNDSSSIYPCRHARLDPAAPIVRPLVRSSIPSPAADRLC